jgi:hypothetical protein
VSASAPFDRATLDAFFAAVLINDVVDPAPVPPTAVPLLHRPERLAAHHALCRQLWSEGLDRPRLLRVAMDATLGRRPTDDDMAGFKHVRAKFKQLRYAHMLRDRRNRAPRLLDRAAVTMGQLQDELRNGRAGRARLRGAQLRLLATHPLLGRMEREAARIDPVGPEGFAAMLDRELDQLAELVAGGPVTGHAFHAARKVVSRQNSFWTGMSVLHPSPEHHRLFRWMSAINGAMGAFHDRLVERRAADRGSYHAALPLPSDVAERLEALVALPRTRSDGGDRRGSGSS